MDTERRTGVEPIPNELGEMLNEAQRRALTGIKYSGWELVFLRRPLFQEPVLVLRNSDDGRIGVLEKNGRINMRPDIVIRDRAKLSKGFAIQDVHVAINNKLNTRTSF